MATFYLDYEGGNDANSGVDFANRWKTVTSGATAARIAPGDTIRLMGSPAPTSLGISATFTNKSPTVTLASALNVLLTDCEVGWTASANVTSSADNIRFRTGAKSVNQQVAGAFTTGLAAYLATGTLNLSAYQGITLWIRVDQVVAGGSLSIRLCSDAAGVTTVDNLAIPAAATATVNGWYPVYIDKGSALGASIQSIAMYVDTDLGAGIVNVWLDNISTVKAAGNDNLNLQSLIGKNTAGETWWAIRGISGTTVTLDESPAMPVGNTARGYYGTTGLAAAYKRETIHLATTAAQHTVQDSGTLGNLITFSGGWDRVDMSTQTLETWWDGMTCSFSIFLASAKDYIGVTKLSCVRGANGINTSVALAGWQLLDGHFNNNSGIGCSLANSNNSANPVIGTIFTCANGSNGFGDATFFGHTNGTIESITSWSNRNIGVQLQSCQGSKITSIVSCNNAASGLTNGTGTSLQLHIVALTTLDNALWGVVLDATMWNTITIDTIVSRNNGNQGLFIGVMKGYSTINSLTTSGNGTAGVQINGTTLGGWLLIRASSISEATKITETSISGSTYQIGAVHFQNYLGTPGSHLSYIHGGAGKVTTELGAGRHTASGIAWTLQPLTAVLNQYMPLRHVLATLPVNAGALVTVTCWVNRSNTGLSASLVCPGRQLTGVDNDVIAVAAAGAGSWEQLTITFTPTEAGAVELELQAYGGTTFTVTADDMTFAQA